MIGVLGGHGFLGTHVCERLKNLKIPYVAGSRRDGINASHFPMLFRWINDNKIESIINLAAECGGIGLNKERPFDLWLSSNQILSSVFEACSYHGSIQKLTTVGTVCSYAKDCPTPFKEEDLFHHGMPEPTNSAYGVAKLSGLLGSMAARQQFGLNSIFLLPANMYGPHDHFDDKVSHVIPALIKRCHEAIKRKAKTFTCWGTGKPTREFLYVEDGAEAIIQAHLKYDKLEPVNIGTGVETSIADIVQMTCEIMNYEGKIIWDHSKPDGQPKRRLDVSKAEKEFGFKAKTSIRDGLEETILWYTH